MGVSHYFDVAIGFTLAVIRSKVRNLELGLAQNWHTPPGR